MKHESCLRFISSVCAVVVLVTGCAAKAASGVLVAPNNDGGEIVLTTRDCDVDGINYTQKYPHLRQAYTYGDRSPYSEGCWTIIDGMVHVLYFKNNSRRVYPLEGFTKR